MPYASDADLTSRVPEVLAIGASDRAIALSDAEAWIDDVVFDNLALQAHVYLAAHLLASRFPALLPGADAAAIASMSAGEISASYAVSTPTPDESDTSTSRWGRMFRAVAKRVSSMGEVGV